MLDRSMLADAMAEIEDMRAAGKAIKDPEHLLFQPAPACQEQEWSQVRNVG